ncbi:phosphatidylinositol kinase [Aureococcus anophagefferens]|nr:phosphatidylinositol kinase [Aureococcus anophagefferens]
MASAGALDAAPPAHAPVEAPAQEEAADGALVYSVCPEQLVKDIEQSIVVEKPEAATIQARLFACAASDASALRRARRDARLGRARADGAPRAAALAAWRADADAFRDSGALAAVLPELGHYALAAVERRRVGGGRAPSLKRARARRLAEAASRRDAHVGERARARARRRGAQVRRRSAVTRGAAGDAKRRRAAGDREPKAGALTLDLPALCVDDGPGSRAPSSCASIRKFCRASASRKRRLRRACSRRRRSTASCSRRWAARCRKLSEYGGVDAPGHGAETTRVAERFVQTLFKALHGEPLAGGGGDAKPRATAAAALAEYVKYAIKHRNERELADIASRKRARADGGFDAVGFIFTKVAFGAGQRDSAKRRLGAACALCKLIRHGALAVRGADGDDDGLHKAAAAAASAAAERLALRIADHVSRKKDAAGCSRRRRTTSCGRRRSPWESSRTGSCGGAAHGDSTFRRRCWRTLASIAPLVAGADENRFAGATLRAFVDERLDALGASALFRGDAVATLHALRAFLDQGLLDAARILDWADEGRCDAFAPPPRPSTPRARYAGDRMDDDDDDDERAAERAAAPLRGPAHGRVSSDGETRESSGGTDDARLSSPGDVARKARGGALRLYGALRDRARLRHRGARGDARGAVDATAALDGLGKRLTDTMPPRRDLDDTPEGAPSRARRRRLRRSTALSPRPTPPARRRGSWTSSRRGSRWRRGWRRALAPRGRRGAPRRRCSIPARRRAVRGLGAAAGDGGGLVGFCLDALAPRRADGGAGAGRSGSARPPPGSAASSTAPCGRPCRAPPAIWALLVSPADAPGGDSKKRKLTPRRRSSARAASSSRRTGPPSSTASSTRRGLRRRRGALACRGRRVLAVLEAAFDGLDGLSPTDGGAVDADAAAVARACGDGGADAAQAAAALRIRALKGLKRLLEDDAGAEQPGASQAATQAASPADDDAAAFGATQPSPSQDLAARVDASLALDDDGDERPDDDLVVAPSGDTSIDLNP